MTLTGIIALQVYLLGCALAFCWRQKDYPNEIFGNLCISAASWLVLLLYAVHWLHNRK